MRLYILGDSTAMSYPPSDEPKSGWGQCIAEHFQDSVDVRNLAIGGRSTKSFLSEGRLFAVEEDFQPGDWALIQFGHNDNARELVWRRTYPETSFTNNLLLMARAVLEKGAHPVLVTPICQRVYAPDGTIEDTFPAYAQAVRKLAKAEGLPLLDMREKTMSLLNTMSPDETAALFMHVPPGIWPSWMEGLQDNTHTCTKGAQVFAGLLKECIRESMLPLAAWLREDKK